MYSPAVARSPASSTLVRPRPLGRPTQVTARGPGWRLTAGEAGSWRVEVEVARRDGDAHARTWPHVLRSLRSIANTHGLRPLVFDLCDADRLAGSVAEAASRLFAELERRGVRFAVLVGQDLVQAARLYRLLGLHASEQGRCFLTEDEAIDWIRHSPPAVAPPLYPSMLRPPRV